MDFQLPVQSVPITTNVVSSKPAHVEVSSIQHYVIAFVSDLRQCRWFSHDTPVTTTNKTDCHDITEALLKVALNIIDTANILFSYLYLIFHILYDHIFCILNKLVKGDFPLFYEDRRHLLKINIIKTVFTSDN